MLPLSQPTPLAPHQARHCMDVYQKTTRPALFAHNFRLMTRAHAAQQANPDAPVPSDEWTDSDDDNDQAAGEGRGGQQRQTGATPWAVVSAGSAMDVGRTWGAVGMTAFAVNCSWSPGLHVRHNTLCVMVYAECWGAGYTLQVLSEPMQGAACNI